MDGINGYHSLLLFRRYQTHFDSTLYSTNVLLDFVQKIWVGVSPSLPISTLTHHSLWNVDKKIGQGPPPLIWTKSKRTATFFRETFPNFVSSSSLMLVIWNLRVLYLLKNSFVSSPGPSVMKPAIITWWHGLNVILFSYSCQRLDLYLEKEILWWTLILTLFAVNGASSVGCSLLPALNHH